MEGRGLSQVVRITSGYACQCCTGGFLRLKELWEYVKYLPPWLKFSWNCPILLLQPCEWPLQVGPIHTVGHLCQPRNCHWVPIALAFSCLGVCKFRYAIFSANNFCCLVSLTAATLANGNARVMQWHSVCHRVSMLL